MNLQNTLFSIFYLSFVELVHFPPSYSLKNKDKPCHQFSLCKCIFPTGRGLNLEPISELLSANTTSGYSILIHLCGDVIFPLNVTDNQCNQTSVCYFGPPKTSPLGKAEDMKITSTSEYQPISIQFDYNIELPTITNVDLICDDSAIVPILKFKSYYSDGQQYNLELQSKHACLHLLTGEESPEGGLSTGSVFVIVFLVMTLVYFGGGMLTLKILRGAEGKEMIPNIDFWMDLPYLVRDGILFTINGFSPPPSYDRI